MVNLRCVAIVAIPAHTLIGRVHVDKVVLAAPGQDGDVIGGRDRGPALKERRRPDDPLVHGFGVRAFAPVVRTIVEFSV